MTYAHKAMGVTERLSLPCPEFVILLYLYFCPQWEHISDFITDVNKKMDFDIQKHSPNQLRYDWPGQLGLMATQQRVVKGKRECRPAQRAGDKETARSQEMVPPKGRLSGFHSPPPLLLFSHQSPFFSLPTHPISLSVSLSPSCSPFLSLGLVGDPITQNTIMTWTEDLSGLR